MAIHRVDLLQNYRGRIVQNVFYLDNPDGAQTQQAMAAAIQADWIPALRGAQFTQHQYFQVVITRAEGNPPLEQFVQAMNIVGTGSSITAHGVLSFVLGFKTGLAGRKNRGRYYIAGCVSGFYDASTEILSGAGTTFFTNACATLTTKFAGNNPTSGFRLQIRHRADNTFTPVTNVQFRSILGVQRRRNVGVGI
jgi:hypothetical protein